MSTPSAAVSRDLQAIARDLDARIEALAGQRIAFALVIFTPGRASYVSTAASRSAVAQQLRDLLAYWEAGMPDVPAHEVC